MPYYRKCEKCGHVEPVAWRGSAFDPEREFADWGEFSTAYPEIAAKITGQGTKFLVIMEDFVYWRAKMKGQVQRVPTVVYRAQGNRVSITWKNDQPNVRAYKSKNRPKAIQE